MKRLRIFAGPNGSGKTTLFDVLPKKWIGIYINPDEIEQTIKLNNGCFDFDKAGIILNKKSFLLHLEENRDFFYIGHNDIIFDDDNPKKICFKCSINSYLASVLASYIRNELIAQGKNFSFETVMSSKDKIDFLKKAQENGFKTYLYFIATDDPDINIHRVENRVSNGGHNVPKEKIVSRYYRTLDNLIDAIKYSDRAFLFDNSSEKRTFICEIENAQKITMKTDEIPNWFNKYLLQKLKIEE